MIMMTVRGPVCLECSSSSPPLDGLGDCKLADLNYGLNGGRAEWTGPGTWTGSLTDSVCIMFYDPEDHLPTCCCGLQTRSLAQGESSELRDCQCRI